MCPVLQGDIGNDGFPGEAGRKGVPGEAVSTTCSTSSNDGHVV